MRGRLRAPLPSAYREGGRLLLHSRRFSAASLLIAADGFAQLACYFDRHGLATAAEQSRQMAADLRDEAPQRARREHDTVHAAIPELQREIEIQPHPHRSLPA